MKILNEIAVDYRKQNTNRKNSVFHNFLFNSNYYYYHFFFFKYKCCLTMSLSSDSCLLFAHHHSYRNTESLLYFCSVATFRSDHNMFEKSADRLKLWNSSIQFPSFPSSIYNIHLIPTIYHYLLIP